MNGLIIYKGKYGATRQYADWLGAALDYPTSEAGYERPDQFTSAAPLIIGTSIYIGKFQVRKWLKQHQAQLLNKKMYLFVVSGTPPEKKEKLEDYYKANVPERLRSNCQCYFLPGKLEFSKLSWTDKLLLRMGARLSRNSPDKITVADYNEVKREHLRPLLNAIKADTTAATVPGSKKCSHDRNINHEPGY